MLVLLFCFVFPKKTRTKTDSDFPFSWGWYYYYSLCYYIFLSSPHRGRKPNPLASSSHVYSQFVDWGNSPLGPASAPGERSAGLRGLFLLLLFYTQVIFFKFICSLSPSRCLCALFHFTTPLRWPGSHLGGGDQSSWEKEGGGGEGWGWGACSPAPQVAQPSGRRAAG